jgi:hypothetical protein
MLEVQTADEGRGLTDVPPQPVQPPAPALPLPSPAPAPVGAIRELICSYGWDCAEALGVVYGNARCPHGESTGNPNAFNAGNYGLFQINAVHAAKVGGPLEWLFDPAVNVRVAYEIWSDQGWGPWACRP